MKKEKVRILRELVIAATCFIVGFLAMSCGADVALAGQKVQDKPLKIWYENKNGYCETWNLVDDETGVNYIVVTTSSPRGLSCTITPRFNIDGSLYVSE